MNQTIGMTLAAIFLLGVGIFNVALGTSYVRKKNRNHFIGWLRILLGTALLATSIWFYFYQKLGHGPFG